MQALLQCSYNNAFEILETIRTQNGFSLVDIIKEIHKNIINIEFPEAMKIFLVKELSLIE